MSSHTGTTTEYEPDLSGPKPPEPGSERDLAIRAIVERLGRRHRSGGTVIERAAILAEGGDCTEVVAWIVAHDGEPEAAVVSTKGGLHGPRLSGTSGSEARPPLRYVLPPSAL